MELAWRRGERTRRGPKPALSLDRVVEAAVELADAQGLRAVSMSAVAERTGFTTMSLYRHVASKDELLVLMVDRATGLPPAQLSGADVPPDGPGGGELWRLGLASWSRELAAMLWRHPWVLDVPVLGPPLTPGHLRWLEYGLWSLAATGLLPEEKVAVVLLLNNYVWGQAQLFRAIPPGTPAVSGPSYGQLLRQLIDVETYPELWQVVESGALEGEDGYSDEDFQWGLDRVLDGVEALVRDRETR